MQTISVKCKIQVPIELHSEIDRTLQGFADACNQILEVAKREKCWNTTKLHHLVYKPVREATGIKANHVCQAIRRVIGNAKAAKQVHKFRPTSINLDARTFQYLEELQTVGVTLMCGRKKFKLSIGNYQLALLKGQSPTAATLNKTKHGDYYINICVDLLTNPTGKTPVLKSSAPGDQDAQTFRKVIGVDLGRRDIATTSNGDSWSGKQIQNTRDRYSKVRANVQSKRTRSSRKLLRRLSGREQRFQKWLNHNISKQLVQDAKQSNSALAFEDLTNIRQSLNQKPRTKTERRRTNNWAFYQLRMFVDYKANIAGVPVVFVPPAYTSQTCSRCHHVHPVKGKSYRSNKSFKCGHCGFEHDADINAALNIAVLGVSVNNPEVPGIACLLESHCVAGMEEFVGSGVGQLSLFPTGGEIWDKAYSAFGTPNRCR
ncbi:RNA-guided endonuclease InsQ/TnpB family protein [Nostoc sp. 'Peltigera membranacea cyanobiont' 213]|uniref:RNA-guided endonuclease InsQ/TnpB family protein n=1 Tax=Nostoc sp. 'Peltigera membranacea cyanobiont' 213 TaxID=2014530 RepID=UPI001CB992FB|nr:RNA-guided endonuclease TnpB family protein [Nostoc sp. 'Peltigera membranacea cyanobiont' 213]